MSLIKEGTLIQIRKASAIINVTKTPLENGKIYEVVREQTSCDSGFFIDNDGEKLYLTSEDLKHVKVLDSPSEDDRPILEPLEPEFSATRPEYYHEGGIDVFKYGEANLSKEQMAGFYRLNIVKYIMRYDRKNGLEDLEKAETYLRALWELESK